MLYFLGLFLIIISIIDICSSLNCISANDLCLTCSYTHYERNFLNNIRLSVSDNKLLFEQDCILKKSETNKRKILIVKEVCQDCSNFDKTYLNLINALEEESKLAVQYTNSAL